MKIKNVHGAPLILLIITVLLIVAGQADLFHQLGGVDDGFDGVGDKVANCVVLFGLQMLDAFPIDVWMKKALKAHYEGGFDPKIFAPYAGIAQQYMFYFARSGKDLLIS